MSKEFKEVVLASDAAFIATRGMFDPAIGSLLSFYSHPTVISCEPSFEQESSDSRDIALAKKIVGKWKHLKSLSDKIRTQEAIQRCKTFSTWKKICLDGNTITKEFTETTLNFDGIAKGWAIDTLVSRLHVELHLENFMVDWAGDIKVKGSARAGAPWSVSVNEPPGVDDMLRQYNSLNPSDLSLVKLGGVDSVDRCLAIFELSDGQAISTSGDYEQMFITPNGPCSHVIDPKTGSLKELSADTVAQSVVVGSSSMFTDALATAALACPNVSAARELLDPCRTGFKEPISDFLLYSRGGPRIVRLAIPGEQTDQQKTVLDTRHTSANIIVVGTGLAGLSAAIEAASRGAKVTLIEKEQRTGGNSAKATSGINGWGTITQAKMSVIDEERLFERDTFRSGKGGMCRDSLVRTLSTKSGGAVNWLIEECQVPLTVLSQLGGHAAKRTHRAPPDQNGNPVPVGFLIMKTLQNRIANEFQENVTLITDARVTKMLSDVEGPETTVRGVSYVKDGVTTECVADAVILATGGFSCDGDDLIAKHRPDLKGIPTTNGQWAVGDGVKLGESLGANLVDMEMIQLHPTGFIDPKDPLKHTKFLAPEMIRGSGGLLVNSSGNRFVDELDLRSVVSAAIQKHGSNYDGMGPAFAWCILAQPAQELFGVPTLNFYMKRLGLFEECSDISACAALIGCDESVLRMTFENYSIAEERGICESTGKMVFPSSLIGSMVVARVTPCIHYTMGGLEINSATEVQQLISNKVVGSHRKIRRLFACGEVTGGVHGANRLGGNSLLECVVFGRIAGSRAAAINQKITMGLSSTEWTYLEMREIRNTDKKYGKNTREIRFNLPGSLQKSGLEVGQYVAIRGEIDGETLVGYFSPITRTNEEGVLSILCRFDAKGGPVYKLLEYIRPGNVVSMKAVGGLKLSLDSNGILYNNKRVRKIGLIAGGTGIAPMMQIIREYLHFASKYPQLVLPLGVNLLYGAEEESDLAFIESFEYLRQNNPEHFRFYPILNKPPLGWTDGVGFVKPQNIKSCIFYPPADDQLIVICGPPLFEKIMCTTLKNLGFPRESYYAYSQDD